MNSWILLRPRNLQFETVEFPELMEEIRNLVGNDIESRNAAMDCRGST